jgi:uncharacterized protein YgbK (DUF1537 family)
MRDIEPIDANISHRMKKVDETAVDTMLAEELNHLNRKIVVLDDDPTGVQTVHNISVYTEWNEESVCRGFEEANSMFFILTNSRSFTANESARAHRELARNIVNASRLTGKDFILISRSDSTLRGHYPLETQVLRSVAEASGDKVYDGEIIVPFFKEGGRVTIDNVHYVKDGDRLIPAGRTEFAWDKSFGYRNSHLGDYIEEKTKGQYRAEDCIYISLDELRDIRIGEIAEKLMQVKDFNKVIVNAVDYCDIKVFATAFIKAVLQGKEFIFRCAAAIPKVLGGVPDKQLLGKDELVAPDSAHGGIILVGSHVNKTTMQLEELQKSSYSIEFIEFNQHLVLQPGGLDGEVRRVVALAEQKIAAGRTVAVYTRRERLDWNTEDKDRQLQISVAISDAVTSIIGKLGIRPNFIIAKGGITSSDVGTKALHVKKAVVMGQIKPGIPVWLTGAESKFPNLPYIIFPGNVGEVATLREVVELLMDESGKERNYAWQ